MVNSIGGVDVCDWGNVMKVVEFYVPRTHRALHVMESLRYIKSLGFVNDWVYEYDEINKRATFTHDGLFGDIRDTEIFIAYPLRQQGIYWKPVPHPGGKFHYIDVINEMKKFNTENVMSNFGTCGCMVGGWCR